MSKENGYDMCISSVNLYKTNNNEGRKYPSLRIKSSFEPFVILVKHFVHGPHRPPLVHAEDPKGVIAVFADTVEFFRVSPRLGEELVCKTCCLNDCAPLLLRDVNGCEITDLVHLRNLRVKTGLTLYTSPMVYSKVNRHIRRKEASTLAHH